MFKNLSTKQISLLLTLFLMISNLGIIYLFVDLENLRISVVYLIIFVLITGLSCYFIVDWLLESFVFSKIKLIYKFIDSAKSGKQTSKKFNDKSINEVNNDVIEWAENTNKELSELKTLENYRKNFVGNVSHELKTPIFSIQGYLHTLLDGALYDEKINKRYLERAASNVMRLQTIVEDLEEINSLDAKIGNMNTSNFNVNKMITDLMEDLKVHADEKNIQLRFIEPGIQNLMLKGDVESIRRVLTNLFVNSIKYGKENGITTIGVFDMDEKVLIEVSDDGIGIPEEDIKHVFDRFYRVDPSRSRELGGSGLGLSIVKHIVEAHGGNVTVKSKEGEGSTFGFTLAKA